MYKLTFLILTLNIIISCNEKKNPNDSELKPQKEIAANSIKKIEEINNINKEIEIISPEVKMLEYLSKHFNRIPDSTFLKKPDFMISTNENDTICGYVISFKEGHSFKHEQECVEWGEIVTVKFMGFSTNQVREIVEFLFKNETYAWYEERTEYRPEKYYEKLWTFRISENDRSSDLEFSYSWI